MCMHTLVDVCSGLCVHNTPQCNVHTVIMPYINRKYCSKKKYKRRKNKNGLFTRCT